MKTLRTLSLPAAAVLAAFLLASPGHALPGTPAAGIAESSSLLQQVKGKEKRHGRVKAKHSNRGNHYGWSKGRGHKSGLRNQGRSY